MFLLDSGQASREWEKVEGHVHDILKRHGGKIEKSEKWAERKLAYEIAGHRRGTYLLVYFDAPGAAISPIRRSCELSEMILRTLIVCDERTALEIEAAEPPPAQPAEAEAKEAEEKPATENAEAKTEAEAAKQEPQAEAEAAKPESEEAEAAEESGGDGAQPPADDAS